MIPADVKTNKIKTRDKRSGGCRHLANFYKNYLQNLKYNVKKECIFHLIVIGILSILILSFKKVRKGGWRGGCSMDKIS